VQYDASIVRPEVRLEQVKPRGDDMTPQRRRKNVKALKFLHAHETMAVNVYRGQISKKQCRLNTYLTAAMLSEMTHVQDFQTKLYEFGARPGKSRFIFWFAGYFFGYGSRILGRRRMLEVGTWVEEEAVKAYGRLLASVDWEEDTRVFVERDLMDERAHIERWKTLLAEPDCGC
jgi:demethoxyubiquinone hydroxylase (CLK1/Coq7/Cat5 family)